MLYRRFCTKQLHIILVPCVRLYNTSSIHFPVKVGSALSSYILYYKQLDTLPNRDAIGARKKANWDAIGAAKKAYYNANRTAIRARAKQSYAADSSAAKAYSKASYARNPIPKQQASVKKYASDAQCWNLIESCQVNQQNKGQR